MARRHPAPLPVVDHVGQQADFIGIGLMAPLDAVGGELLLDGDPELTVDDDGMLSGMSFAFVDDNAPIQLVAEDMIRLPNA
ncbi:hypothetical protein [Rhizorhabdus wittichii]|uniref:hypothetical protein n=1 Tax=Rhizorhabdus wittichii TaxID=160791 RepID=UPI00178C4792|nr:hypothetical protein [Rhizorhabdus wittichii]